MFRSNGPILILSGTSGCLDALGFLGLGRVFTANMTGNTVLFGLAIAQGNWLAMQRSLIAMVGFSLGVIAGTLLVERNYAQRVPTWTPQTIRALVVESGVLLIFALGWSLPGLVTSGSLLARALLGISALAMGQQSATVLSLGIPGISTTYITGTITTLMANVSRHFSLYIDRHPVTTPAIDTQVAHQKPARMAAVWLTYIIAAIIGGYGELHFPSQAAFLPLLAIITVILISTLFPPRTQEQQRASQP